MTTSPPSPTHYDIPFNGTSRKTRQSTRLRRLTVRSLDQPRPTVNVNPATGRRSGPHKEKFHSYLGVVARDKIPIVHSSWNDEPETLKNLIWDYILVSQNPLTRPVKSIEADKVVALVDPLGELVKNLFEIYQKPIQLLWDGAQFGIDNVKDGFFITHVKESQKEVYIGPYLNRAHWQLVVLCPRDNIVVWFCSLRKKPDVNIKTAMNSAMKTLSTSAQGMADQLVPQWIEAKIHVQMGGYECGYYVMP
ncbi:hypothetical protein JHK87_055459 [Glycine soja]|nr:hypothetical protein JHK87_055459 [Glycine soja]